MNDVFNKVHFLSKCGRKCLNRIWIQIHLKCWIRIRIRVRIQWIRIHNIHSKKVPSIHRSLVVPSITELPASPSPHPHGWRYFSPWSVHSLGQKSILLFSHLFSFFNFTSVDPHHEKEFKYFDKNRSVMRIWGCLSRIRIFPSRIKKIPDQDPHQRI